MMFRSLLHPVARGAGSAGRAVSLPALLLFLLLPLLEQDALAGELQLGFGLAKAFPVQNELAAMHKEITGGDVSADVSSVVRGQLLLLRYFFNDLIGINGRFSIDGTAQSQVAAGQQAEPGFTSTDAGVSSFVVQLGMGLSARPVNTGSFELVADLGVGSGIIGMEGTPQSMVPDSMDGVLINADLSPALKVTEHWNLALTLGLSYLNVLDVKFNEKTDSTIDDPARYNQLNFFVGGAMYWDF